MSLKDMRDELRKLRKEAMKPTSRMKKADIASELERLRGKREETPPVASTVGAKPKKMEAKIADVKVAKEKEFPTKPVEESKKKASGKKATVVGGEGAVGVKTKISKSMLREMLDSMSDSD
jgi:hypothetical protein